MSERRPATSLVLAVDGGNSKTDVALVRGDGVLLAATRGSTISHQAVGLVRGMDALETLVDRVRDEAGLGRARPAAEIGAFCLAGADFPGDIRSLRHALGERRIVAQDVVRNDVYAALRAGTERPWGVALICGQGVNGAAVAPDGRTARFDAVGDISGDWGGGDDVGRAGLAAAVRARDGRGPRTILERTVPAHFGVPSPPALTRAFYWGRIPEPRIAELSRVVFAAAAEGDLVARGILDRLADELVAMATALIRRLRMTRGDVEVVLAGGVFRSHDQPFLDRILAGTRAVAPGARLVLLRAPPVAGAALMALDRLTESGTPPDTRDALRAAFEAWHASMSA